MEHLMEERMSSLYVRLMYGDARYHSNGMQARGGLALQIGEHCSPVLRCSNILLTQIIPRKEQKPCAPMPFKSELNMLQWLAQEFFVKALVAYTEVTSLR